MSNPNATIGRPATQPRGGRRPATQGTGLPAALAEYQYAWPQEDLAGLPKWDRVPGTEFLARALPESAADLAADSRWPAFFPSPICLVTTTDGTCVALEKVVGPSIVNRFPYVLMISFCKQELSARHHIRGDFMKVLERGGAVAVQFLPPGADLDRVMEAILTTPEDQTADRIARTGLKTRPGANGAPVFESAFLAYEGSLVRPQTDFDGNPIYDTPWADVGSHRAYFLEINTIRLREDIARGQTQIQWRSLPAWQPAFRAEPPAPRGDAAAAAAQLKYQKGYTPNYVFPSAGTIAFEQDELADGMAVKHLAPLAKDQVEVDNDRARWPAFFPSSAGLITTWGDDGIPNLMPCGSTTIVSRHPLVIAPCVSYAGINQRYAPRASLDLIRKRKRFACAVPFVDDQIIAAIKYCGNVSITQDPHKVANGGLNVVPGDGVPVLAEAPVTFECEVTGEVALGTHIMFLGEARRILVRSDVTPANPLEWCPWAALRPTPG